MQLMLTTNDLPGSVWRKMELEELTLKQVGRLEGGEEGINTYS